jgi:biopolymer transport protein ExbD
VSSSSTGSSKIVKPGYHIRPKYDLHGLRHRRSDHGRGAVASELPLTSMIDMFAILVVYLLMNFSATGDIFFLNKGLLLPKSATISPLKAGPLLTIKENVFTLDAPPDLDKNMKNITDETPGLDQIVAALKDLRTKVDTEKNPGSNRINIQAGEDSELGNVKRAMAASVSAGWSNINFVVDKKKE